MRMLCVQNKKARVSSACSIKPQVKKLRLVRNLPKTTKNDISCQEMFFCIACDDPKPAWLKYRNNIVINLHWLICAHAAFNNSNVKKIDHHKFC